MTTDFSLALIIDQLRRPRFRQVLTGFLVLCSLIFVGLIVQSFITPVPQIATSDFSSKSKASNFKWNWFPSVRQAVVEVEPEETEELARASIKAELLGVLISADSSYAAISTSKNPDGVYAVGDSIENNVTLEKIEEYRVVISQRGSRRQIPLKSLDSQNKRTDTGSSLIQVEPSSDNSGFNLSGLVSTQPIQLPSGGIGLKLGGLSDDLTDLADVQEGDVVVAVNGTAVSDMMTNPLLWQQFSQQTNMPVTIMRGDEQIDLFVNAASLSQKILPRLGAGQVQ